VRVKVTFEVDVPKAGVLPADVRDWLRFGLRDNGELSHRNPLVSFEPEPVRGTFKMEVVSC
jgi:hypothetical protein